MAGMFTVTNVFKNEDLVVRIAEFNKAAAKLITLKETGQMIHKSPAKS